MSERHIEDFEIRFLSTFLGVFFVVGFILFSLGIIQAFPGDLGDLVRGTQEALMFWTGFIIIALGILVFLALENTVRRW